MATTISTERMSLAQKLMIAGAVLLAALAGSVITIGINSGQEVETHIEGVDASIEYAEDEVPAMIEGDRGEILDLEDEAIPTVDEVDGGLFQDIDTGLSVEDGMYADLGWTETYDVSSPEAFKNATLGHCIIANNYYGAQCVSLVRVFWWSYANRDVSTCGTGMAKGMMDCWQENAGSDFETHWGSVGIQAGDIPIWGNGLYGHVGMALGPEHDGYITLLGQNQGGSSCGVGVGGSATNIINLSVNGIIGYYRPKAYARAAEPVVEPALPISNCTKWHVLRGDTMSKIMLECENTVVYGPAMDAYAKTWYSLIAKPGQSVYDGWHSKTGVGLYENDDIEHRTEGE